MILKKEHLISKDSLKMVYSRKVLDYLKESDEISSWEEGFMHGYLNDEEN